MNSDPLQLLSYVKQIFDRTLDEKIDAERELAVKGENECNDYEAMLQKLEAEVRQHIRVTILYNTLLIICHRSNSN